MVVLAECHDFLPQTWNKKNTVAAKGFNRFLQMMDGTLQ